MSVTQRKTKEEVVENLHDVAREMLAYGKG